jgi:hypothetical protein
MYRQHSLIAEFLLSQAHADWDADTFKEGVKQAIEYSSQVHATTERSFLWLGLIGTCEKSQAVTRHALRPADCSSQETHDAPAVLLLLLLTVAPAVA